jgi:DNA polymerase III epsilon subunit-like protein
MYLSIDTETGGIGLDKTLLEISLIAFNEKFEIIEKLTRLVKPDDNVYHIDPSSLRIHKIDLGQHRETAVHYVTMKSLLYDFLYRHKVSIPVGFGVKSDIDQICDKILSRKSWDSLVSTMPIEISTLARLIEQLGGPPTTSLEGLGERYRLVHREYISDEIEAPIHKILTSAGLPLHRAEPDAILNIEVFKKICEELYLKKETI